MALTEGNANDPLFGGKEGKDGDSPKAKKHRQQILVATGVLGVLLTYFILRRSTSNTSTTAPSGYLQVPESASTGDDYGYSTVAAIENEQAALAALLAKNNTSTTAAPVRHGSGYGTPFAGFTLASANQLSSDLANHIPLYWQASPGTLFRFTGKQQRGTPLFTKN